LNWSDYLWVPIVIALFVVVPAAAIALKRGIQWCYKRLTGKDRIEAAELEQIRRRYAKPDWSFLENHLGRIVPPNMKTVYESPALLDSPIVKVGDDEYFLYAIYSDGLAVGGFYPLGQNELGEALFLSPTPEGRPMPLCVLERGGNRRQIYDDAAEFFQAVIDQNAIHS
jgi:hypothetical protein